MITDRQVRNLMALLQKGKTLACAAAKADMDEKTARKYRFLDRTPSQCQAVHDWRTRADPFAQVWPEVRELLEQSPGLDAKTLFEELQRRHPERFAEGQLRTLQRRVLQWRVTAGPAKEVFFAQEHRPGLLCESDFTHMTKLNITLAGRPFAHLLYHFVLTYSNWETGLICPSESRESLSEGLQNALFELGGVPVTHRSDRMSAAINSQCRAVEFTRRYQALLDHYGLAAQKIQTGQAHENGDVEQRHHRFKRAVEQALLLRGSRDFADREEYRLFLRELFRRQNAGRQARLAEERKVLRPLPARRLEDCKRVAATVGFCSTVRLLHNVYSVPSRLIGAKVEARLYAERVELWYGSRKVEDLPRLQGEYKRRINYRHVIEWLVRKPGAFENYRYRDELFPSSQFRMAYDALKRRAPAGGHKEYLKILLLAARENESLVEATLRQLLKQAPPLTAQAVETLVQSGRLPAPVTLVHVAPVNLAAYDALCPAASAAEVA